jgi:heat shock protein beta
MQKGGDMNLIGQFGVGFYSVYLVADYVEVVSKHNDDPLQYIWESRADGAFAISEDKDGEPLGRGTQINIYLKEEASEYADQGKLKELVAKYSEFINFPIYLHTEKEVEKEVPIDEEEGEEPTAAGDDSAEGDDDDDVADEDEDAEAKPTTRKVKETVREWELLNDNKALWLRPAGEVDDEEYTKFYKALSKDYEAPLTYTHFKAEGDVEFKSILFVPAHAEPGMFDNYYAKAAALKLYVRRVFISDEFNELLPKYLSFMKGIVDSDSLPLNVSRENLQQHSSLKTIKKKLVRKALDMLRKLADDGVEAPAEEGAEVDAAKPPAEASKYDKFWKAFGKSIKLGIIEDASNRVRLAKLLRFTTSQSDGKLTSLEEYVSRMKPWQKQIFYLTGDSEEALKKSPFLEKLLAKGVEVIFFTDPIDEYTMQNLTEFEDFKFQNASKEDLKIGDGDDDAKKAEKALKARFKQLTAWWKGLLPAGDVEAVKISQRLSSTPCVVVSSKYGWSANMERIMKAQALGDDSRSAYMKGKKILEINPNHSVIRELRAAVAADADSAEAKNVATVLFETALLESGYSLDDAKGFAERVLVMAKASLNVDPAALAAADAADEAAEAASAEAAEPAADAASGHDEL